MINIAFLRPITRSAGKRVLSGILFLMGASVFPGLSQTKVMLMSSQAEKLEVKISERISFDDSFVADLGDSLVVKGGTPPYSYTWKSGTVLSETSALEITPTVIPLKIELTVIDSHNCKVVKSVTAIVGIEEENVVPVSVYPVPATSMLTIDPGITEIRASIITLSGTRMWEETFSGKRNIALDLKPGVYLLEIIQGRLRSIRKVIIN